MSADIISLHERLDALCQERLQRYIELDKIFQATKRMEDGISAGRARQEFYDLFASSGDRCASIAFREFGRR